VGVTPEKAAGNVKKNVKSEQKKNKVHTELSPKKAGKNEKGFVVCIKTQRGGIWQVGIPGN